MPGPAVVPIALGLGSILSNVFGSLFGASKQANAAKDASSIQSRTALQIAEMERKAAEDQLAYLQGIDQRDYGDWLSREARDRTDFENTEKRRAPFRALADSAVRTLADYIRVPGMQPAQEIPVQQWTHQGAPPQGQAPVNSTMPVGGNLAGYVQPVQQQQPSPGRFVSPQRRSLADYAR